MSYVQNWRGPFKANTRVKNKQKYKGSPNIPSCNKNGQKRQNLQQAQYEIDNKDYRQSFINNRQKPNDALTQATDVASYNKTIRAQQFQKIGEFQKQYKKVSFNHCEIKSSDLTLSMIRTHNSFSQNQIQLFIYNIADRNNTIQCNYPHFLIPYAVTLQMMIFQRQNKKQLFAFKVRQYILKKMMRKQIQKQISHNEILDFAILMLRNTTFESLYKFLRNFLIKYKNIMISFIPYYYNYFALVINKQRYFQGRHQQNQEWIGYTVDINHKVYQINQFSREVILDLLNELEQKLIQKYHQQQSQ